MSARAEKVIFITPGSTIEVRFVSNDSQNICASASTLGARYFVAKEQGTWGVFDMRRADPNGGGPRKWSMPDPLRVFPNQDAAVMFAVTRAGRT